MELQSIGQVSKQYDISIHTLRYYEEIGLIQSARNDDNAYRFYDEAAVKQLHSIILLRKLRISLKQIKEILDNQNAATTVEIFERNISELDEEITSLSTIKSILTRFAEELREKADVTLRFDLLNNKTALSVIDSLSFSKNHHINNSVKENFTMEDLNKANETLSRLKDSDVRIIYVPPMTVAAAYGLTKDEGTEKAPDRMVVKFVRESGLLKIKPDARCMMANHVPKEYVTTDHFLYKERKPPKDCEFWVSIPDDMEVPAPLTKKTFKGGLYAAHLIRTDIYEDSHLLAEWVNASEKYEFAFFDDEQTLYLSFMELLNFYNHKPNYDESAKEQAEQCELLAPIKKIAE